MPERRWRSVSPEGAAEVLLTVAQTDIARRLTRRLLDGKIMRWDSLARLAPAGLDRLDVERTAKALFHGGLVEIAERRDAKGDFHPYQIRKSGDADEALRRLAGEEARAADVRFERASRLIAALEEMARQPGVLPVPARTLVQRALGNTKIVRVADYRAEIEAAFEVPLDTVVRDHTAAVLTSGPFRFSFRGAAIDGRISHPWTAIPEPVLRDLVDLTVEADEILTVENLTPFETLSFRGEATGRVLLFTSGFLGRAERRWLEILVRAPRVRRVVHWGDIDPGGLAIYRDIADLVARVAPDVNVSPWQMDAEALEHPAAVPLTARDRIRLERWVADTEAPLQGVAQAMLASGRKLEQEALLL